MQTGLNPSPGFQRNPAHRIIVEPYDGTVTVRFSDAVIASTDQAKVLREGDYPPAFYIPFDHIYFERLLPSQTKTHCPFKGDASYWNVTASGEARDDVMWAYASPFDEMAAIANHGAFYPDKVAITAVPASRAEPLPI